MPENTEIQLNPFEKLYKKELSSDELEEMKHSFFGFMNLLIKIDKEQKEGKND